MVLTLQWTLEGERQISRVLLDLDSNLKDFSEPFGRSAEYLKGVFSRDVFDSQGAAIGEKWKRLSPYTVAQKARKGFPSTPLIASGRMRESFKTIVSSDQAVIYNTAEYFKYHQSNQPRSKLPRRVMMKISNNLKTEVVRFFQTYIQDSIRGRIGL